MPKRDRVQRVQVFRGADGQWYVRRVSSNGRVLLHSEGYRQRQSAVKAAALAIEPAVLDDET